MTTVLYGPKKSGLGRVRAGLAAAALAALTLGASAPAAMAGERIGIGFDADEGLAGRDIVSVLAEYDTGGGLTAQVFFAGPIAASPPAELTVSFSPDPNPQACAGAGAAVIRALTAPGQPATIFHPALGRPGAIVQRAEEIDSVTLSVRDPRLADLALGCVQVQIASRDAGPPVLLDALGSPLVLAEPSSVADTPLDLGGPGDRSDGGRQMVGAQAAPPRARIAVVRGTLAAAVGRGMLISVPVTGPSRLRATLHIGPRTARRIGVRREIARGSAVSRRAGRVRIRLQPRRAVRALLAGRESIPVTLVVRRDPPPGGGSRASVRRLKLR